MRRFSLSSCLAAGIFLCHPAAWAAQPGQQQSDNQVTLNFADTDIPAVLRAMSLYTHRNFVVDPRVKGKLTLMSEHPVSSDEALSMLSGALRMQGYALVQVGRTTRVVPEADAKLQGSPVLENAPASEPVSVPATGSYSRSDRTEAEQARRNSLESFMAAAPGSEIVTRVFPLKYENANNLIPVLRPLVPPNNTINAYPGNNTLVITDYADNLERIAKVIARIDVPTSVDTDVVPLKFGIAADIAALATQLLDAQGGAGGGGDPSQRITVAADPRSNSVVIRSGSPSRSKLAHDLVVKLDARQERAGGNMHVVYLRNAQAAHIARVLGGLLTGRSQTQSVASANGGGGGGGGSGLSNVSAGSRGNASQSTQSGASSMNSGSYGLGGSSQGGLGSSQPISRDDPNDGQPTSFAADGAVVQADTTTNSLIISAPEPLYRDLRTVIDQLDQRRAQVLVESLIVEVSQDESSQFGIQWMTGGGGLSGSGSTFVGGANLGGSGLQSGAGLTTLDSLGSGLSLGVIKGTTTVLGNQIINLGVLARAMQGNNKANILSTPNLLTLDNEQASIMVGKTVPFVTGQYVTSGSGSSTNPFQTIQREDVGLKLNIKPQISEGGSVKLDIYQEVSSIDTASSSVTAGIVTDKRAIDTSVLADDGDIIVLGGLLQDDVTLTTNSVPGLSSIPILGALFRYDTRERVKTNLMVFLRPYVLRDGKASADLTLSRYNYMRRAQSGVQPGDHWLLPDMNAPILPPANVPTTSSSAYDLRAGHLADTMRREPPATVQTYAVRQVPAAAQPKPSDEPIHAILPVGVGVTSDPSIMYAQEDSSNTTLQIAQVDKCGDADPIIKRVGISGLKAYSQTGPGGTSCVVRTQVARDSRTVDTAVQLLRELGYRAELVQ